MHQFLVRLACVCCFLCFTENRAAAVPQGTQDTGDVYTEVVWVETAVAGGQRFACSGILLSPRLVLTAGHCVRHQASTDNPRNMKVKQLVGGTLRTVGVTDVKLPQFSDVILDRYPNPDRLSSEDDCFCKAKELAGVDAAAIILDGDLELRSPTLLVNQLFSQQTLQAWGDHPEAVFGELRSKTIATDSGRSYEGVLVGYGGSQTPMRKFRDVSLLEDFACTGGVSQARGWVIAASLCVGAEGRADDVSEHGDSGGPIFLKGRDGHRYLVGLTSNSGGVHAPRRMETPTVATSVLGQRTFIQGLPLTTR
jgi:Trypsin